MEYHVKISGNDRQDGSFNSPFRTIGKAASLALPGDIVTVYEGTYREWVNPKNGGSQHHRITYRAAKGDKVIITGAEIITHWIQEGHIWKTTISNDFFGSFNPYATAIYGDWFFEKEKTFHTGEVYLNGKSMYETQTLEGVLHPQETENSCDKPGSLYTWYCEVDKDVTTIWANFHGEDPRRGNVEINVRPFVFWPELSGRGYITVQGFTLKQAATQWAPPTALQEGLIGPHWSKGWIIEDNVISDSKNVGISLGKEISTGHNEWTRTGLKGGTQREREVIFRSLHHAGWHKDNVGGHIVRNNIIHDCEQAGIVGHLGSAFCTIENNHIYRMHYKRQYHGAEVGGIKLHAAIDTKITGNVIHDSYRGLWLDWQAQGTHVSRNVFYDNSSEDFMVEVCHGPYMVDHNLFLSEWALKDMSSGGAFVHNLFLGKIAACTEHTRTTPYHFPHHTAVYGVSHILGGDNRFYNNIFIRNPEDEEVEGLSSFWSGAIQMDGVPGWATFMKTPVGISQYDEYPAPEDDLSDTPHDLRKLPIYSGYNLYLNDAKPYANEEKPKVYPISFIEIEMLDREKGKVLIRIRDVGKLDIGCKLITTETLGISYHAEMGYEEPDGSPFVFDTDFFGNKRELVLPGPFEVREDGELMIPHFK